MLQCDVCHQPSSDLVRVFTCVGEVVKICRHGHFEGEVIDAYTGMLLHMSGPRSIDALVWFPEGYAQLTTSSLMDMKPAYWWKEEACQLSE